MLNEAHIGCESRQGRIQAEQKNIKKQPASSALYIDLGYMGKHLAAYQLTPLIGGLSTVLCVQLIRKTWSHRTVGGYDFPKWIGGSFSSFWGR